MVQPPTGTATFLFTDVEGSTRLWEEHPDVMRVALERHDAIMRAAIEHHDGYVFTTAGDSFAAAFQDHASGVSAAAAAQLALQRELWPDRTPIGVRMGVHTGDAWERDGDYFGPTLNMAARLMSAGHGGQVLLSAATTTLLRDVEVRSLGVHRLKDLSEAVEIFELETGDVRFPALRTLDRVRHNLPVTSAPLLGREQAVTDVTRLLDATALVTVVGVGGMGKTRLALAVAAEVADRFVDGVWFCDLAPVDDADAVAHVVADALGARQRPGRSMLDSVAEFCGDRQMLIVVDNCEHVLDHVADLVEAITSLAPNVGFLATSREGLGLDAEVTYPLGSLDVGPRSSAVELFLDAAARVDPTRVWSDAGKIAIVQICVRLDGIPLAIELAAARTRSMAPIEIEERLHDAFRTLRGGRRSIERHRTLQTAIEWSYNSIGEPEQALFSPPMSWISSMSWCRSRW
jgi:class 3 adenylate cyclase